MPRRPPLTPFTSARKDVESAQLVPSTPQTRSPSYRLAYADAEFMMRDELRPVRLQVELLKPELVQRDHGIDTTVVVFGSARLPDPETAARQLRDAEEASRRAPEDPEVERNLSRAKRAVVNGRYYEEARRLGQLVSGSGEENGGGGLVVITGGGPGIMEAANRGAHDVGAKSIGLNIVLPHEQAPNPYITPELCFQFHYFAIRKMHFLMRARALVAFPGGFGTLDELTDTLTLIQTRKIEPVSVILFGKEFWDRVLDFQALVDEGMISQADLDLFCYVDTAEEAAEIISQSLRGPA